MLLNGWGSGWRSELGTAGCADSNPVRVYRSSDLEQLTWPAKKLLPAPVRLPTILCLWGQMDGLKAENSFHVLYMYMYIWPHF